MNPPQHQLKAELLARRRALPSHPEWGTTLIARLEPLPKGADEVRRLCTTTLLDPVALAHPQWEAVVRKLLDLTWSWKDACRTIGGFEAPDDPADDESDMGEVYEELHTFDAVLRLLATPGASSHPAWARLVEEACRVKTERVPDLGFGKPAAELLLEAVSEELRAGDGGALVRRTWRLVPE